MNQTVWIILLGGLMTYLTRVGGHVVLSRFEHVHPRVEMALNAVPAAVLTTLVAPSVVTAGPAELITLAVVALLSLRAGMLMMFLGGTATIIVLRQIMG